MMPWTWKIIFLIEGGKGNEVIRIGIMSNCLGILVFNESITLLKERKASAGVNRFPEFQEVALEM